MKVIKPSVYIETPIDGDFILKHIEKAGRVCYKSESNITDDSNKKFIENIIKRGHESVIEHFSITAKVICDRGVSHEIVRHRMASYSQESTRYCNYSNDKFGNEITVIKPCYWEEGSQQYKLWYETMLNIEKAYIELLDMKASPQEARSILPNSLKTELFITMNLREWRHFFKLRLSKGAHPQMIEVAEMLFNELKSNIPIIFDDIDIKQTM